MTFKVRHGKEIVEIPQLSKLESRKHAVIGTSHGQNDDHCLYLAVKNGYKFLDRVVGYRRKAPTDDQMKVALTFYGEPTPREWSPRKRVD